MKIIFFLIACSVVLALLFLMAFFWAQKNGQNQDLYTPSVRILLDDEIIEEDEIISKTDKKPS
jgi:cbb3-type cytochrome oxidase maturation protein